MARRKKAKPNGAATALPEGEAVVRTDETGKAVGVTFVPKAEPKLELPPDDEPPDDAPPPVDERDDLLDHRPPAGPPPEDRLPPEDNVLCGQCGCSFPEDEAQRYLDPADGRAKLRCISCQAKAAVVDEPAPAASREDPPECQACGRRLDRPASDTWTCLVCAPSDDTSTPFDDRPDDAPPEHETQKALAEALSEIGELQGQLSGLGDRLARERAVTMHLRTQVRDLEILLGMDPDDSPAIAEWMMELATAAVVSFPRELDERALAVAVADVVRQAFANRTMEAGRVLADLKATPVGSALLALEHAARRVSSIVRLPPDEDLFVNEARVGEIDNAWMTLHSASNLAREAVLAERARLVSHIAEARKAAMPVAGDRRISIRTGGGEGAE